MVIAILYTTPFNACACLLNFHADSSAHLTASTTSCYGR
jgi:hypothetical protein